MKLTLVLSIMPTLAFGMDQMAALSMIETGNNDRMVGRAGEISRYQVLKREWHSVTNSYHYSDPATAKAVSERLLARRVAAFRKVYHRDPTNFEFYALWNAPGQVLNSRVSRRVAERCQRYANLCDWNQVPLQTASATPAAGKLMF
jgi:hypothetical protein